MSKSLKEVAAAAGCDYDFINNAIRRDAIRSRLLPTTPGVARAFTRDNALEIAFAAAYARAGIRPGDGDFLGAFSLLQNIKRGRMKSTSILIYSPDNGRMTFADDGAGTLDHYFSFLAPDGRCAMNLVVVNLGEIVRRIDTLFSAEIDDDAR